MRERRIRLAFFAAVAFLLLYSFPYFAELRSANELPRAYLTQAIVEEGTFAIDTGVERWGTTADVSPAGDHLYSNKAPGSSFLAVPGYLVLKSIKGSEVQLSELVWVARVTTGVVPTFLFLLLFYRFLGRFCPDESVRRLVVGAYALGTMAMTYSVLFIAHQLSAVCIATAYIICVWVLEDGLDWRWMLAAGLAAGAAPLTDYQAAFAGIPIAAYVIVRLWQRRKEEGASRRNAKVLGAAIAGASIPIAALLLYHDAAFGSPFATGYAASETFAHHHQRGFLGLDEFRFEALVGSMVASDNGLLLFSPILLWAVPGWWWMRKDAAMRWPMRVTLGVAAIYVLFISSIVMWRGGWQMGPRYITAMLPFCMIPVAVAAARVDGRVVLRGLLVATALVGLVIYGLSCAEYPHFPEKFKNPIYEVTFRLIADGHAPFNLGRLVGLRGLASLAPYVVVLVIFGGWISMPQRGKAKSAALGLALATAIIAGYSLFPGGGPAADAAYTRWVAGVMP